MIDKYKIVKKYIDEFDYYGLLAHHAPDDEFDSYSHEIADIISEDYTVEQIACLISNTLDKAFGNEVKPEKFIDISKKIKKDLNS